MVNRCVTPGGRIVLGMVALCVSAAAGGAELLCPIKDLGGAAMYPLGGRLTSESWVERYSRHPLSELSKDYFCRFSRDPAMAPSADEIMLDRQWRIAVAEDAAPLTRRMAADLRQFLAERMELELPLVEGARAALETATDSVVALLDAGWSGGRAESFRLEVGPGYVRVAAADATGVRAGVVRLVHELGLHRAPIVAGGITQFHARHTVRVGRVPLFGTYRDVAFQGHNSVVMGYTNLYEVSQSDALPELVPLRDLALIERVRDNVRAAREYGLRTYLHINTRLFDGDSPLFLSRPELRGAKLHFGAPNRYVLCSEHPDVGLYLDESLEMLIKTTGLDGVMLINGGEEFYHCFMRAVDTEVEETSRDRQSPPIHSTGRTNCARCNAIGAERAVANLVNRLARGALRANPNAEVVAWPYSATYFWSADNTQAGFIERMGDGTALLTEPEKEEYVDKPGGVRKSLWDYSIDLIGPGRRAKSQLEATRLAGIPLYFKSDHEHAYEAPRLPYIPCVDRWWDRAEALAASGAEGVWVFSYVYRPNFGTTGTEIAQWLWWDPVPDKEETLQRLAARIAGRDGGPHLRNVWRLVSDAIGRHPGFVSQYFSGPDFLGPEHPMLADPHAELPEVFYVGRSRARAPVYDDYPRGNVEVFASIYGEMRQLLQEAMRELDSAEALAPDRNRVVMDAEAAAVRFLYHTTRTQENFYRAFPLRNRFRELVQDPVRDTERRTKAAETYAQWRAVLEDELENARAARNVMEQDLRLYQLQAFSLDVATLETKLSILQDELQRILPELATRHGVDTKMPTSE